MRVQKGFTLVELVVVVMILGILAAVAAPKLLGTSGAATDAAVRQSLAVVRDAIDRYSAENNGDLPAVGDLPDLLRGGIPVCPVGTKDKLVVEGAAVTGEDGAWLYNSATGEFRVNSNEPTKTIEGMNYSQL